MSCDFMTKLVKWAGVSFGRVITGTRSQGQGYYGNKGRVITAFPRNFLASPLPLASLELWPFWASFYYFKSPPGETQIFFFGPVTFVSNCQGKMVGYVGLIRANWCLSCFFLLNWRLTLAIRPSQDAGKQDCLGRRLSKGGYTTPLIAKIKSDNEDKLLIYQKSKGPHFWLVTLWLTNHPTIKFQYQKGMFWKVRLWR